MATATTTNGSSPGKVTLYTNHGCPFAQRAHITLDELQIPYDEILIDLNTPRPQWYLDINPRGLVPSIRYSQPGKPDEIITESAVVAQFFADQFPSTLLPASNSDALKRARINFFTDTWSTKVSSQLFPVFTCAPEQKEEKAAALISAIEKEIEPLLAGAGPFFGGSKELTFAEVITAPFVLRMYDAADDGELAPKSLAEGLDKLPNFGKWAKAVREAKSTTRVYDGKAIVEAMKKRFAKK